MRPGESSYSIEIVYNAKVSDHFESTDNECKLLTTQRFLGDIHLANDTPDATTKQQKFVLLPLVRLVISHGIVVFHSPCSSKCSAHHLSNPAKSPRFFSLMLTAITRLDFRAYCV